MKIFGTSIHKPEINSGMFMAPKSTFNSNLITVDLDVTQKETIQGANVLNFTKYNTFESPLIPSRFTTASPSLHVAEILGGVNKLNGFNYENMFDISSDTLSAISSYSKLYQYLLLDKIAKNTETDETTQNEKTVTMYKQTACAMSLFNDWYGIDLTSFELYNYDAFFKDEDGKFTGIGEDMKEKNYKGGAEAGKLKRIDPNITDCRTSRLVAESEKIDEDGYSETLGWELFKMPDFLYCRDAGNISNNRLITLRVFPYPIGDDIKSKIKNDKDGVLNRYSPDRGRMLCWLNEDNKLEDILKYNYNATWKEFNAKIQEQNSKEDSDKLLNSIINLTAPQNISNFAKGFSVLNNNRFVGAASFIGASAQGPYDNELLTNYDNNEIYEPKDTVRSTHKYDGELKFSHEFTLTFDYELRAYENINPRTAFLDLLANIHDVTYRRGKFWGGSAKINGTVTNRKGWQLANQLIEGAVDKSFGVISGLMSGETTLDSVWGFMSNALSQLPGAASNLVDAAKDWVKSPAAKKTFKSAKDFVTGMVKNTLGRPAQYAFDSLLTGKDVGLWHVTIGNPFRPILSIGNLIITNTEIEHYGALGIDDFPTGLKVRVTLKHAIPRDITEIQRMYTGGATTISHPFTGGINIKNYKTVVGRNPYGNTSTSALENSTVFEKLHPDITKITVAKT